MTKVWCGLEGKKVHLEGGVNLTGSRNDRDRRISWRECNFPWWWDNQKPQHCLVAILEWDPRKAQAQRTPLDSRAGLGNKITAGLRCPMQPLLESVLLRAYIKSLHVMQLCRVHVEPLVAVGLCPGYCSLSFSFIFKQKCVYLKMYHKNSPSSTMLIPFPMSYAILSYQK